MFAVQRDVMLLILEPETPGGLRASMDCRYVSSSATADDMMGEGDVAGSQPGVQYSAPC